MSLLFDGAVGTKGLGNLPHPLYPQEVVEKRNRAHMAVVVLVRTRGEVKR